MPTTIVTTSWDDGHHIDLRLADRLATHRLKGTFYVALNHPRQKEIADDEIQTLQRMGMEIGSHTLTHRLLTGRLASEVRYELKESKARLEDIVGAPVVSLSSRGCLHGRGMRDARRDRLCTRTHDNGVPHDPGI